MALFYITGAPGSGKSTVQKELAKRGYDARDLDDSEFGGPYNKATSSPASMPPIELRTPEWFDAHEWRVSRKAVETLKQKSANKLVYLCGTATTENHILDLFDKVIYLNVDENTLRSRIANRKNNDFGKTEHELVRILVRYHDAQEKLASSGFTIINANGSLDDTIKKIIFGSTG